MRKAGDVVYADVDYNGEGVVEFSNRDDMERAVDKLDDEKFENPYGSSYIRVRLANKSRGGDRSRSRSVSRSRSRSRDRKSRDYDSDEEYRRRKRSEDDDDRDKEMDDKDNGDKTKGDDTAADVEIDVAEDKIEDEDA
jgi:hypothetical protein